MGVQAMSGLGLVTCFTILVCAATQAQKHGEHAAVGTRGRNSGPAVKYEEEKIHKLEERLEILEQILVELDIPEKSKYKIKSISNEKDIESDVEQNKEDIIDLRITDGRHDMLLSQAFEMSKYINNTIIPMLEEKVNAKIEELELYGEYIDSTRPPIGSIVAWVPAYSAKEEIPSGWQRCNGEEITKGPLKGKLTPDLNMAKRFLRGGSDETAGTFEDDSVQDHSHEDSGHSHADAGHTHYEDSGGAGHWSAFFGSDEANGEDILCSRNYNDGSCGGYYMHTNSWSTENGFSAIQTAKANIQAISAGLGGMRSGRTGTETRPKNMNVAYIMRIM